MATRLETVFAAFAANARTYAAKPFLCDPATWQDLSYGAAQAELDYITAHSDAGGGDVGASAPPPEKPRREFLD